MTLILYLNLWILVCALAGMFYGIHYFRQSKALYLRMVVCSVACLMFARLFYVITIATQGTINPGFHVGLLGIIGSFMFLLSANYGQMDGLVDDRSKAFRKTRLLALIVPVVLIAMYVVFFLYAPTTTSKVCVGVPLIFILPCSYYNFKHIIIYDVELGIIRPLRKYNIVAVIYAFLAVLELMAGYIGNIPLYIVSSVGIGIVALIILPVLKGGTAKWTA